MRNVHAENDQWQLVRYPATRKWYLVWLGPDAPPPVDGVTFDQNGRSRIAMRKGAAVALSLDLAVRFTVPGGDKFEAEIRRITPCQ